MATFQMVTRDGEDLGPMEFTAGYWPVGSVISRGSDKPAWRVVELRVSDGDDLSVLVVEEV